MTNMTHAFGKDYPKAQVIRVCIVLLGYCPHTAKLRPPRWIASAGAAVNPTVGRCYNWL